MKVYKTILLLCVALCFATACKKDVDMTLVQKTVFENADIGQIEVSNAWQVTVVADSSTFVELEYSAYLEPYLKARMDGSKLEIGFVSNIYPVINSVYRATIHTPKLEKTEAKGASEIHCLGSFSGQQIEIELSGASKCNGLVFSGESCTIMMHDASLMTGFQCVGNSCTAMLENASQFNGQIQVEDRMEVELKDASRFVNKEGTTRQASTKLLGASILNMVETEVASMDINLSEGSEATVRVVERLEGTLKTASTLYYKGHPQIEVDCSDDSQLIPF